MRTDVPPAWLYNEDGACVAVLGHKSKREVFRDLLEAGELDHFAEYGPDGELELRLSTYRGWIDGMRYGYLARIDTPEELEQLGIDPEAWSEEFPFFEVPADRPGAVAYTFTGADS